MKQLIKSTFDISVKNWPILLLFDIVYKIFSYSILYTAAGDLLSLILETAGVPYLGIDNFYLIFKNPIAVILSIAMLLLITFSVFFEIAALYIYCECGWQQKRLSMIQLLKRTLLACKKLFHVQNILLFFGFILTNILTILPFSPYLLQWLRIPEFIMEFINQKPPLLPVLGLFVVLVNSICFLFLFSLPFTIVHHKPIWTAWKEGWLLLKKRKTITVFRVLGVFAVFGVAVAAILGIALFGLLIYTKFLLPPAEAVDSFILYFNRAVPVTVLVTETFAAIWLFSVIITLFHQYKGDVRPARNAQTGKYHILKRMGILICTVFALAMFGESELGGSFIFKNNFHTQVIAHRGGAAFAPENTMAALNAAIAMDVDMVEIDVQQLGDGTLILLHDSNFKRTAAHNKDVWEASYPEVRNYDAGSWFSPKFAGEPVPKLDDILQQAKGKIQVMIELKLTGHEDRLVERVLELITQHDMLDQCNIASLNLGILREAKALNPKVQTLYITPLIFSGQYDIDFIDAFSVETTFITREMVATIQFQRKKIYGWTANSKETIEKNLQCQVNGIVTDNPEMVKYYAQQAGRSQVLNHLTRIFFKQQ